MKGPEHYAEAERLSHASGAAMLAAFEEPAGGAIDRVHLQTAEAYAARAQVHATLALAAATALGMSDGVGFEGMRAGGIVTTDPVTRVIALAAYARAAGACPPCAVGTARAIVEEVHPIERLDAGEPQVIAVTREPSGAWRPAHLGARS